MTVNDLLAIVKAAFLKDDGEARQQLADAFLDAGEVKTAEVLRYGSNPARDCYSCGVELVDANTSGTYHERFDWNTDDYGEYLTEVITCIECHTEHVLNYRLSSFCVIPSDEEEADNICLSEVKATYAPREEEASVNALSK